MSKYVYKGDRHTSEEYKGKECEAVKKGGKCIRKGSKMLVKFGDKKALILARRLRKIK